MEHGPTSNPTAFAASGQAYLVLQILLAFKAPRGTFVVCQRYPGEDGFELFQVTMGPKVTRGR